MACMFLRGGPGASAARSIVQARRAPLALRVLREHDSLGGEHETLDELRAAWITRFERHFMWEEAAVLRFDERWAWAAALATSGGCVTLGDPCFPRRWGERLGPSAPAALYRWSVCPDLPSVSGGGARPLAFAAVVGRRDVSTELAELAAALTQASLAHGYGIVSGGADGVDRAARDAFLAWRSRGQDRRLAFGDDTGEQNAGTGPWMLELHAMGERPPRARADSAFDMLGALEASGARDAFDVYDAPGFGGHVALDALDSGGLGHAKEHGVTGLRSTERVLQGPPNARVEHGNKMGVPTDGSQERCPSARSDGSYATASFGDGDVRCEGPFEDEHETTEQPLRLERWSLAPPGTPFSTVLAMERNALIYAMADFALAVGPHLGRGGTWNGAKEAIRRRLTSVILPQCRSGDGDAYRSVRCEGSAGCGGSGGFGKPGGGNGAASASGSFCGSGGSSGSVAFGGHRSAESDAAQRDDDRAIETLVAAGARRLLVDAFAAPNNKESGAPTVGQARIDPEQVARALVDTLQDDRATRQKFDLFSGDDPTASSA